MRKFLAILLLTFPALAQVAQYPSSVVTNNQLMVAVNFLKTTLSNPISNIDSTITVANGTNFGANMLITVDSEIMLTCSAIGNIIRIGRSSCPNVDGRGFDGTVAAPHAVGVQVAVFIDAWHHNSVVAEIKAIENALGPNLSNVQASGPQAAGRVYSGPISGGNAQPTFRLLTSSDLPGTLTSNTSGTAAGFTGPLAGDVTGNQGTTFVALIQGHTVAPSAYTDTTNAANITGGTLSPNRLPSPTVSSLGGVQAKDCSSGGQFLQKINPDGSGTCGTPAGAGNVTGPGTVTSGFLAQWGNSSNTLTTGIAVSAVPAANTVVESNSGGVLAAGWLPAYTGDATSSSGSTVLTLNTVNSSSGACGDGTHVCAVTTNSKGLVTAQSAVVISGSGFGNQTANFVLAGPTSGAAAAPTFRALVSADVPNNAADTSGTAAGITGYTLSGTALVIGTFSGTLTNGHCVAVGANNNLVDNGTACGSGSGSGSVTSVALALPGIFTVSGSPVTTTGTLTGALATQSANLVWSGPTSGSAAAPTFRSLVVADIPANYLYSSLSGAPSLPISIANGGTGASTAAAGFDALSPMTALGDSIYGGSSGTRTRLAGNITSTKNFLCQTGTGSVSAAPAWCAIQTGDLPSGVITSVVNDTNVTGSAVAGVLTLGWTGTAAAGRLNANVVQAITNDTNVTGSISGQNLTLGWTGQLSIARGGTGQATASAAFNALSPMTTLGDLIYGGTSGAGTRLAGETSATRKFLRSVSSTAPAWDILVSGDIPANGANTTGNAATATALAATPTKCASGNYPLGVDALGNAQNCTSSGIGSVTSVSLALPNIFTISGSPVTSTGTLTGTFATQTAGIVFAGPGSGGAATPTFRALISSDIPATIASNTSGTAAGITGYTFSGNASQILSVSGTLTNGHCLAVGANGNAVDNGSACGSGGGGGSVTNVALALPNIFTVTGSPITTTGTLTGSLVAQVANAFFAGPTSGTGVPAFRAIGLSDIPAIPGSQLSNPLILTGTANSSGRVQITPSFTASPGETPGTLLTITPASFPSPRNGLNFYGHRVDIQDPTGGSAGFKVTNTGGGDSFYTSVTGYLTSGLTSPSGYALDMNFNAAAFASGCTGAFVRGACQNNPNFGGGGFIAYDYTYGTPISAASNQNPVRFTAVAHGMTGNPTVFIDGGTGNWAKVNNQYVATIIDANTFSIPVDSSSFGALTGSLDHPGDTPHGPLLFTNNPLPLIVRGMSGGQSHLARFEGVNNTPAYVDFYAAGGVEQNAGLRFQEGSGVYDWFIGKSGAATNAWAGDPYAFQIVDMTNSRVLFQIDKGTGIPFFPLGLTCAGGQPCGSGGGGFSNPFTVATPNGQNFVASATNQVSMIGVTNTANGAAYQRFQGGNNADQETGIIFSSYLGADVWTMRKTNGAGGNLYQLLDAANSRVILQSTPGGASLLEAPQGIQIGNTTPISTATPLKIDMGATFSNAAGANLKLKLFNDGSNLYGLGVSAGSLDYAAPTTAVHSFYVAGTLKLKIDANGCTGCVVSTNDVYLASSAGQTSFVPGFTITVPDVFVNGIKQRPGSSFSYQVSGGNVVFNAGLQSTDVVEIKQ